MQMLDSSLSSSLLILLDFDLIVDIFVEEISLLLLPSISKMLYNLDYLSSEIQRDLSVLTKSIAAYQKLSLFSWQLSLLGIQLLVLLFFPLFF